jgi:hypothetical protein
MALGVSVLKRIRYPWAGGYGIKDLIIEVTGEASYVTNGSAITAAQLNVNSILAIAPSDPYPLVARNYVWDRGTGKLLAQAAGTGNEVSAATNCSADKIVCTVYAR